MYDIHRRMKRTQIYLTEEQWSDLHGAARRSGTTVASLIRQAVDRVHRSSNDREGLKQALRDTAGLWAKRRDLADPVSFVRRLRKDRRSRGSR